ncbi:sigma-70 family RNA polymerase sigma factor [Sphingobium sp. WCS2017Hpa-17]|uniref:sigma-70 family RNA polymerase sigma factor n=1 Tax=Sphingobium sp. WCS2017Hpa-17 TaxID=3073638 RepID=UPI002889B940|nr:sigma-70 family RNA polymerase sigma factor [Sphingobium sp. WCS2017Hpa-17]
MANEQGALYFYRTHRASLIDYARVITGSQAEAEDVVQDAWIRFDRAFDGDAVRQPLHYLYRIVRNLALDGRRRALIAGERQGDDLADLVNAVPCERPTPEAQAIARNELDHVRAALAELPERTRIAVEMHRFGGHTLMEIAQHLGVSVGLVHGLVADGIKHCHRRRMAARE